MICAHSYYIPCTLQMNIVVKEWTFQFGMAGQPYPTLRNYLSPNRDWVVAEGRQGGQKFRPSQPHHQIRTIWLKRRNIWSRHQIAVAKALRTYANVKTFDLHDPCEGLGRLCFNKPNSSPLIGLAHGAATATVQAE